MAIDIQEDADGRDVCCWLKSAFAARGRAASTKQEVEGGPHQPLRGRRRYSLEP